MKFAFPRRGPGRLTFIMAACLFGIGIEEIKRVIDNRMAWDEYETKYGSQIRLPHEGRAPAAQLIPQLSGEPPALFLQLYRENRKQDVAFKSEILKLNSTSPWKATYPTMGDQLGEWEAKKGDRTLIFSRLDNSGWCQLTLVKQIAVDSAAPRPVGKTPKKY